MRYIKKLALNTKTPANDRFSVSIDGDIVTNTTRAIKMPSGTTAQRPSTVSSGLARYNSTIGEFEYYVASRSSWETVRTVRPGGITVQNVGVGDYYTSTFGPLTRTVSTSTPQNILVFVENVYQLPVTNYSLVLNPDPVITTVTNTVSLGSNVVYVSSIDNLSTGSGVRSVTGLGIDTDTTIVSVGYEFDAMNTGYPITLSTGTVNDLSAGTVLSVGYATTGTYIQFTDMIPDKTVTTLFGFDGSF